MKQLEAWAGVSKVYTTFFSGRKRMKEEGDIEEKSEFLRKLINFFA